MDIDQPKSLLDYRKSRRLRDSPVIYAGIALSILLLIIYVNREVLFGIEAEKYYITETKRSIKAQAIGAGLTLSGALVGVSSYFAYYTCSPGGVIATVLFTATGWGWCVASLVVDFIALTVFGALVAAIIEVTKVS